MNQFLKFLFIFLTGCLFFINAFAQRSSSERSIADSIYQDSTLKVHASQLSFPASIAHINVEPSNEGYQFLHDPAIVAHKGQLIAAWYACPEHEIVDESRIHSRRSNDGGVTWSEIEVIAEDRNDEGIHYVPAQLLSTGDNLYAFVGKMKGHDIIISTAIYQYNESNKIWEEIREIAQLFLPNCMPEKLANGNWILAGRTATKLGKLPVKPAVLISEGDRLDGSWRVVALEKEPFPEKGHYPETTLIEAGNTLYSFVRSDDGVTYKPHIYSSTDFGETWVRLIHHDFRAVATKMYGGTLSTGQNYMLFNYVPDSPDINSRGVLAIAVSSRHVDGLKFARVLAVQSAFNGSGVPRRAHYPSAFEYDGNLYVIYTAEFEGESKRQCELAIIPLESLAGSMKADSHIR